MTENQTRTDGWPAHRVTGVDVWPFRMRDGETAEFLLLHRSGRDGSPFWQGVSGWIEAGEPPHLAALRELREETGLEAVELYSVDALFDLYAWSRGTVEAIVPFAALVAGGRGPDALRGARRLALGAARRGRRTRPLRAPARGAAPHRGGPPRRDPIWRICTASARRPRGPKKVVDAPIGRSYAAAQPGRSVAQIAALSDPRGSRPSVPDGGSHPIPSAMEKEDLS